MVNYPAQIDNNISLPPVVDNLTPVVGSVVNRLRETIIQMQLELGIKPSGLYTNVRTRLDSIEAQVSSLSEITGGAVVVAGSPQPGNAIVWTGSAWVPSNNFVVQAIKTGGALILDSRTSFPASEANQGIIYYDSVSNKFLVSENGGPYLSLGSNITFSGDLTGTIAEQTVIKINGATVPTAGSLTTGNILQVSGNSSLTYGPLNLAGGTNYVTGLLPVNNQSSQAMGGDVSGTTGSATVTKIQSRNISSILPTDGYVLTWIASNNNWEPKPDSAGGTAGGDLSNSYPNPNVAKINGATVPSAGSLTTGNVLQVSNSSALSYGSINLAGGTNFVTGLLPIANQAAQSLSGDLSGATSSATVIRLQGRSVSAISPNDGYVLTWVAANSDWEPKSAATQFTAGGDLSGSSISQQVISITGSSGLINVAATGASISWESSTVSPTVRQYDNITSFTTGQSLTIQAQNSTGSNSVGGNLNLKSGAGTSEDGYINLQVGATTIATISSYKLISKRGKRIAVTSTNVSYTILNSDEAVIITLLSAPINLILPSGPTIGDIYTVKDSGGNIETYNVTISGNGYNIDGVSTFLMNKNYSSISLLYTGFEWSVL